MLTISIYKNVPLQASYANVILFNNASDVLAYLDPYKEGTISNINKFFSNETTIDLNAFYEDCNYMCIEDTRSNKEYKFFFIENMEFVSGGTIRYSIILDVWNTYSYNIIFKPSRMITGHANALQVNNIKRKLITDLNGDTTQQITKYLTSKWDNIKYATLIVVAATNNEMNIFFTPLTSDEKLHDAYMSLTEQKYRDNPQVPYRTFEIINAYIINSFDLKQQFDNKFSVEKFYTIIEMGELIQTSNQWYRIKMLDLNTGSQNYYHTTFDFNIAEIDFFGTSQTYEEKTQKLFKRYKIGSLTNNQEVLINSESNPHATLTLYIYTTMQIAIYLKCENAIINMTNDFEIPYINDNFTLYMARNKATLDANNKANAISLMSNTAMAGLSLALAPATAGASVMFGAGMVANSVNTALQFQKQQAQIENARQTIDRADTVNCSALLTLINGCGLIEVTYENNIDTENVYNNFGTSQKVFVDTYKTNNTNLYNFYFLQFDDININGDFAHNVKSILETIFTNGVRIWCDASQYLNNVNYIK